MREMWCQWFLLHTALLESSLSFVDGKWHEDADGVPFSSRVMCLIAKRVWCEPDMVLTSQQLVWTCMVLRGLSPCQLRLSAGILKFACCWMIANKCCMSVHTLRLAI